MKIAIHLRKESFSDRVIQYCEQNKIPYKLVNCFDSDIIKQLNDCDVLFWHWFQNDPKAILCARQILYSVEKKGLKIFPDFNTVWHFDDKIGQKYLLEAIDAPFVSSYVFYDKESALKWINDSNFPKVFKLKDGAGSYNVKLVKSRKEALKLCNIAFSRGFKPQRGYKYIPGGCRGYCRHHRRFT